MRGDRSELTAKTRYPRIHLSIAMTFLRCERIIPVAIYIATFSSRAGNFLLPRRPLYKVSRPTALRCCFFFFVRGLHPLAFSVTMRTVENRARPYVRILDRFPERRFSRATVDRPHTQHGHSSITVGLQIHPSSGDTIMNATIAIINTTHHAKCGKMDRTAEEQSE